MSVYIFLFILCTGPHPNPKRRVIAINPCIHPGLIHSYLTRSSANDFVFDLRYLRGYIMLQDMVEGSIVSLQASPDIQPPGVYLQMTPYPCHLNDE